MGDYEAPFHGLVGQDPTFEEMKKIVVKDGQQPAIPSGWRRHDVSIYACPVWNSDSFIKYVTVCLKITCFCCFFANISTDYFSIHWGRGMQCIYSHW